MIDLRSCSKKPTEPNVAEFPDIPLCLDAFQERSKHKNGETTAPKLLNMRKCHATPNKKGASAHDRDALHTVKT
ncbi:hypothetical protein [Polyangium jinanense]|uniref:Uncharacterized protein n=1 Tax=Polyangium jinanense TaxID=2829994 RepID=A0A9X3X6M7_9BACT|nr:hypothetical protein [Polyangium jinanense]MDC3956686.1 hypothetical protein [Polyangium jinanense]MDC3984749.1 hypothetical protein [Polyangium jinanense]